MYPSFSETRVVALDISKVFDRVFHEALVSEMESYGISAALLRWTRNLLTGRSFQVVLDGSKSLPHSVNAEVPQGSVLSPTLFLIFINDLLTATVNPMHSFADDSSLSASYNVPNKKPTLSEAETKHQQMALSVESDINIVMDWGLKSRVEFNASKTQHCLLSARQNVISQPLKMNDAVTDEENLCSTLGITVTKDLRCNEHIYSVAKNASRNFGYLKRWK